MPRISPKIAVLILVLSAFAGAEFAATAAAAPAATGAQQKTELSKPEQRKAGRKLMNAADALSRKLSKSLEQARKDGKIELAQCLNDKLTRVDALRGQLKQKFDAMVAAVDTEARKHNFTVMGVIGDQIRQLQQLAGQCTGAEMFDASSGTKVVTEIEKALIPFEVDPKTVPVVPPFGPPIVTPPATKTKPMDG